MQTDALAAVGERGREVGRERGLADPALGGEHGDQRAARLDGCARRCSAVVSASCRAYARATASLSAVEVALLDDLAHAGAQGLGEHGGVDAATDQDDADGGLGDPQGVGQRDRRGRGRPTGR